MPSPYHIMTQLELETELENRMRDTTNLRWTDLEFYRAINMAVQKWGDKVVVPFLYTPADWVYTQREYTLPNYVRPPLDVLYKTSEQSAIWREFTAVTTQSSTGTGILLVFAYPPRPSLARVIWWARNSPVPTTVPTITGSSITSSSLSVTLNAAITNIADAGYIKAEQEWMMYSGVDFTATTTTLNNLVRGIFGTAAASHNTAVSVHWGIAVHRVDLYEQLYAQAMAYLHSLFLNNAAATEKETYQWGMRYWQQQADEYWRVYWPARQPKQKLGRMGIGEPLYRDYHRVYTDDGLWPYYP